MAQEAMYASLFGEKKESADQMAKAVAAGKSATESNGLEIDLDELSASADGFDSKVNLMETLKSFQILAEIEAKSFDEAFQHAVELTHGESVEAGVDSQLLASCVEKIESPLVGYAFGKSLEMLAVSIPLEERLEDRKTLLSFAKKSLSRTAQLFDQYKSLELKYPQFVAQTDTDFDNLRESSGYLSEATDLQSRGYLNESLAKIQSGLSRHPQDKPLWDQYFQVRFELLGDQDLQKSLKPATLLRELELVRSLSLIPEFEFLFYKAAGLEAAGQLAEAEVAFAAAVEAAQTPRDQIRVISERNRVRLKLFQELSPLNKTDNPSAAVGPQPN